MARERRGQEPLMVSIEERLSPDQVSRLRFQASIGALSNAFCNLGKAAQQTSLIRWPAEILTAAKLSPWSSQEKHAL